jgi:hypothetical protein
VKILFFSKWSHAKKNLQKKKIQYGAYFQNGVCTVFLYENMSCDRHFGVVLIFFDVLLQKKLILDFWTTVTWGCHIKCWLIND